MRGGIPLDSICKTTAALLVMTVLPALSAAISATSLRVTLTVGLSENEIVLNRPIDVAWSENGDACVLNQGDGTIAVFSGEWRHLQTFSRCGEAPGELSHPAGLCVVGDELWVKVPRGAAVFDSRGAFLRLQRLPPQILSLSVRDGLLFGTASYADGVGVRLDLQGQVQAVFGPPYRQPEELIDLARCAGWMILPARRNQCALLDCYDGRAWPVSAGDVLMEPVDLSLARGQALSAFEYKSVISDACYDPQGGYFVIHYPERGKPGFLYHFSERWRKDGTWSFPDGVRPGIVRLSPRDELCLIEETSSVIYVCPKPAVEPG